MDVGELVAIWPEKFPRPDPETTAHNDQMTRKFARDFQYRDAASISREEARDWALANPQCARYVRTMFNDAITDGLLVMEDNPFARLRLPRGAKKPVIVPTLQQVERLIAAAAERGDHSLGRRIEFAAFHGLRFAEQQAILLPSATGLGNIFDEGMRRLRIDWQYGRDHKLKAPKTKNGIRPTMISPRARHAALAAASCHASSSSFLWPERREEFSKAWKELRRDTGIWIKWHALRHHAATWFLNHGAGIDDVAKQLGCSALMIRETYGHPDTERALQRLEELVDEGVTDGRS